MSLKCSASEEWLDEISIVLDPEDGRLGVLGLGEESTTAFTRFGIDNLAELTVVRSGKERRVKVRVIDLGRR